MSLILKIFKSTPIQVQNLAVTLTSTKSYKIRHGGKYRYYRQLHSLWDKAGKEELEAESRKRLESTLKYARKNSKWYKNLITDEIINKLDLQSLPILEKKDIVNHLDEIRTIGNREGVVNQTSGTTGAAMTTYMTNDDMQERWAIVDNHKALHGFELGEKTAWFSGKDLITEKDISNGICSHYDFINKICYYSTFHISNKNFEVYWNSLNRFKPKFIVGFPSSIYNICEIADSRGLKLTHKIDVFFSTSETLIPKYRDVISKVLGCEIADHYSASEGAPIIIECEAHNLHMNILSGVFEVLDREQNYADEGELIVTSFTSHGTPLIRYRVGDRIKLASVSEDCPCGSNHPMVERIEGRASDYIYSPQRGKINLVNIGNSAKGITGIICFQIIQEVESAINVLVVKNELFNSESEEEFVAALKQRVGSSMKIYIKEVDDIPREKSGKFRIVINKLKITT